MPFDEESLVSGVDPDESVTAVAVHMPIAIGSASVAEQDGDLVGGLRVQREVVPHHVGVLEVGLGVPLLGVDEVGELAGVSDEEDGRVVASHVPVALLGVELDREASRVPFGVRAALLPAHRAEPD